VDPWLLGLTRCNQGGVTITLRVKPDRRGVVTIVDPRTNAAAVEEPRSGGVRFCTPPAHFWGHT
jgi:hypothetical protein